MAPAVLVLAALLLFAHPHLATWALPAYAGLLAWNGRHWFALIAALVFVALNQ